MAEGQSSDLTPLENAVDFINEGEMPDINLDSCYRVGLVGE